MARDLVASGEGVAALQVAGRWASAPMPAHYARAELAGEGSRSRFHGELCKAIHPLANRIDAELPSPEEGLS